MSEQRPTARCDPTTERQLIAWAYKTLSLFRRSCRTESLDWEELESVALAAAATAWASYDPARGTKLSSYVITVINCHIREYLRQDDWMPRSVRTRLRVIEAAEVEWIARHGAPPREEELAAALGWDIDRLAEARADGARSLWSLDDPILWSFYFDQDCDFKSLGDTIPDPNAGVEPIVMRKLDSEELARAVSRLPQMERRVVRWYYGDEGPTMKEIARRLRLSESRIHQLYAQAIQRLRQRLGAIYVTQAEEQALEAKRESSRARGTVHDLVEELVSREEIDLAAPFGRIEARRLASRWGTTEGSLVHAVSRARTRRGIQAPSGANVRWMERRKKAAA